MDGAGWWAIVPAVSKSRARLSTRAHAHTAFVRWEEPQAAREQTARCALMTLSLMTGVATNQCGLWVVVCRLLMQREGK